MSNLVRQRPRHHWIFGLFLLITGCGGAGSSDSQPGNHTISGAITIPEFTLIDSDVNDPNAPYISNDYKPLAQVLPNPVTVGGYVNIAGEGLPGRSMAQGDVDDYYFTRLLAGQVVRLTTGNPGDVSNGINDLDVALIDDQGQRYQSQQSGNIKIITASNSGDYYIHVSALSGASDYLLEVSLDAFQPTQSTQHPIDFSQIQDLNINSDFVPGEVIVKFKTNAVIRPQISSANGNTLQKKAGAIDRAILYQLSDQANYPIISPQHLSTNTTDEVRSLKRKTLETIKELRSRPDVESARPNYIRRPMAVPNDQYYQYQWNLPLINLPQAWDISTGSGEDGNDVIVAVIDTGILPDHPDLQGQLVAGYDFIRDANNAADGNGIDDNPFDEGDGVTGPSSFHGTHVSGIIAATTDNKIGVAGIAWKAKIMPLRVLGKMGGTDYDIEQAIRYAAGLNNDSGTKPTQRADVINLSLGGLTNSTTAPDAYTLARQAGVIIVAAAGNNSTNQLSYPASLDGVVSVSSISFNKILAPYSNYGSTVDVTAPGGNTMVDLTRDGYADGVLSTLAEENSQSLNYLYAFYQGTSMAAPHVAGVAALMKAIYRPMSPDQFDQWLSSGVLTNDLGAAGRDDYYGNGLIDANKAVNVASNAAGNTLPQSDPIITSNRSVFNFSTNLEEISFTVSNAGSGSLEINSIVEDSGGWLTVIPQSVDSTGLGAYILSLDRSVLSTSFTATSANISITSSAGNLVLPVLVLNANQSYPSNAGIHYIQLRDVNDGHIVKQTSALATNGQYSYSLDDIPLGSYMLIAGSNPDNNNSICEATEACGQYYKVGIGEEVIVNETTPQNLNLNFETGFQFVPIMETQPSIVLK